MLTIAKKDKIAGKPDKSESPKEYSKITILNGYTH